MWDASPYDVKVYTTLDRREALKDADFIILIFYIGGTRAYAHDIEIPLKYGVKQCIGDSMGPGGMFSCSEKFDYA